VVAPAAAGVSFADALLVAAAPMQPATPRPALEKAVFFKNSRLEVPFLLCVMPLLWAPSLKSAM